MRHAFLLKHPDEFLHLRRLDEKDESTTERHHEASRYKSQMNALGCHMDPSQLKEHLRTVRKSRAHEKQQGREEHDNFPIYRNKIFQSACARGKQYHHPGKDKCVHNVKQNECRYRK